ncbi:MAG TPA: hypothetical protein VFZ00_35210 [Solirubrobacter sp.]|nr:hypothetical protein [Solirubrobacter sp.]
MEGAVEGVASLYTYFAATIAIGGLLLMMPPYRPMNWLSPLVNHRDR